MTTDRPCGSVRARTIGCSAINGSRWWGTRALLAAAIAATLWGCEAGPTVAADGATPAKETLVADLPFSQGKRFETLDAYLAHLQQLGTMDIPYYERREDGTYVYIAGRVRPGPDDVYTREQLLERFGFSE